MPDNTPNSQTVPPSADRRGWLASLLLRQPERFLPRLTAAVGQWRNLSRRLRRRLQRHVATTALGAALLLALSGAALYAPPAHAAAITVDDGYVIAADDGFCSLSEAIRNANNNSQQFDSPGECAAGSGDDVINLPAGGYFPLVVVVDYTGFSEVGLPAIASTITIEGNGSTIHRAIDNPGLDFRLMAVLGSGDLTLNNVTLSNGYSIGEGGGALHNYGTVTINESIFLNNHAKSNGGGAITNGGFYGSGVLEINDSYFAYNQTPRHGGAVYNHSGTVTISGTTITKNQVGRSGGGIYHRSGSFTLIESVVTLNKNTHDGAGIFSNGGVVEITDSNISHNIGNRDGGGLFSNGGTVTITDSDIHYNTGNRDGGGVFSNGGTMSITDSDVSNNTGNRDGGGVLSNNGGLTITGSEIHDNTAVSHGGGVLVRGGTFVLDDSEISDNSAVRGGGVYHAGTTFDLDDSTISGNGTTAGPGGGIHLAAGTLDMDGSTLSGNHAIGGGGGGLRVMEGATAEIHDSAITHNYVGYEMTVNAGGGINNSGALTIVRSTISNNAANGSGGGIVTDENMWLANSTISGNSAGNNGGGIRVVFDKVTIENSTLTDNVAGNFGGGISQHDYIPLDTTVDTHAAIDMKRSIISGNEAGMGKEMFGEYDDYISIKNTVIGRAGITFNQAFPAYSLNAADGNFNATEGGTPTALDAILDPTLADNGGPTLTHLLVEGSPALDLGPSAQCATGLLGGLDQRSQPRNLDADGSASDNECDAGAVEGTEIIVDPVTYFLSVKTPGSVDGQPFGNEDILKWDDGAWSLWFDGSAALLDTTSKPKHNINAFWIPDAEEHEAAMSFAQHRRHVPDIPFPVDGMDLVWWDGDAFSFYFDGSDVGLTKKGPEKIDALHILDGDESPINGGDCAAYLLISTQGPGKVPNDGGGTLKFGGEDILGFCATELGEATAGHWHMALDGSAEGLPKNSLDSISVDGDTIYFTTSKAINLGGGVAGGHSTVYAYNLTTGEFSGPHFKAAENGLGQKVDGLQMD